MSLSEVHPGIGSAHDTRIAPFPSVATHSTETFQRPNPARTRVQAVFETMEEMHGCTDPHAVASALHEEFGDHIPPHRLERLFLQMPTREFLYEGASETVQSLLEQGDQVRIWTQGHEKAQLYKAALAGFGDIRRQLSPEDRQHFTITASRDKIATLDTLINTVTDSGVNTIYIVDDKAKNVKAVNDVVAAMREEGALSEDVSVTPVWINQGRTKDNVPPGYTVESFTKEFATIEDIRQLSQFHPSRTDAVTQWLLDLDHTLLHTAAAKQAVFETVSALYPEEVSLLPEKVRRVAGLNGNISSVSELASGMSPNTVVQVTTDNGDRWVVKHNTLHPEKLSEEIEAYNKLKDTPLADYMIPLTYADPEQGVLVQPYFEGREIRQGIKNGSLTESETVPILEEVLAFKEEWWSSQEKAESDSSLVSMQRTEWEDTKNGIFTTVQTLAHKYEISPESLMSLPLQFQGETYPSLTTMINRVHTQLDQAPPYTIFAHNDVSGANILVNPESHEFRIIDGEWAGQSDPAEAYVRLAKYISSTTVQELANVSLEEHDTHIEITMDAKFAEAAITMQNLGFAHVSSFAESLDDPSFADRFRTYLTGSYLREVALAPRRGNVDLGLLALVKAADAITTYEK